MGTGLQCMSNLSFNGNIIAEVYLMFIIYLLYIFQLLYNFEAKNNCQLIFYD